MLKRYVRTMCVVAAVTLQATTWTAAQASPDPTCAPAGAMMRLARLPEMSGLVASRATPGRLWTHNDSGKTPEIFALDAHGTVTGRVSLAGAAFDDWEAMASGPCGDGACLYVADIGDNNAKRKDITIYRVPEPVTVSGAAQVDGVFRASYPDGAHNAETLLAAPDGRLYIVTKGDTGQVGLYRFPRELLGGTTMRLDRVGDMLSTGRLAEGARITDGAISPDGEWVILRSRTTLMFHRAADFLNGNFREARRIDLTSLGEPQGEAVAFGPRNTVYVAGEGGGRSQPGTLAVLSCANENPGR